MKANGLSKKYEQVYARLGKDLSATSSALTAAEIILNAADELIGWEACYLILYDPEQGGKPRSLVTMDTINDKRVIEQDAAPEKPSENMLKAIRENGFLSLHEEPFDVPPHYPLATRQARQLCRSYLSLSKAENVPLACFPYKAIKQKPTPKVRLRS
jgi:hypothetical protein